MTSVASVEFTVVGRMVVVFAVVSFYITRAYVGSLSPFNTFSQGLAEDPTGRVCG